ncbi:MAG: peptidyl-prolyl cis-trans isomerase [Phycisphaerae bacterium]|nr:peptidyl-prolyl cis-trans isomerase [Phycisphaerae bacterium]
MPRGCRNGLFLALVLALAAPARAADPPAAATPDEPRARIVTLTPIDGAGAKNASRPGVVLDAFVGQVNGKPIFASELFRSIGEEELQRLGQAYGRAEFQQEVTRLIVSELRTRVTNSLILAEAERGLTSQQQAGLRRMLEVERQKILAQHRGSVRLAEIALQKEKGHDIASELEARRQRILTDKYLQEKLRPRIHVSRRDVERYYHEHPEQYSAKVTVSVRLILVKSEDDAEKVDAALTEGAAFEKVASELSAYRPETGGLQDPLPIDGSIDQFQDFAWDELNEKVRHLKTGQHTDRTKVAPGYAWAMLEKLDVDEARSLPEVFLDIERRVRAGQFNRLSRQYLEELTEDGNYTPIKQMAEALLDVALTRFARTG